MKDLVVLILSCDKYSDLWKPFFVFFEKYWRDRTIPAYFCSDTKKPELPNVNAIAPDINMEWSARLLWALQNIKEPYVLLLLDDYFLTKKPDEKKMLDLVEVMKKLN